MHKNIDEPRRGAHVLTGDEITKLHAATGVGAMSMVPAAAVVTYGLGRRLLTDTVWVFEPPPTGDNNDWYAKLAYNVRTAQDHLTGAHMIVDAVCEHVHRLITDPVIGPGILSVIHLSISSEREEQLMDEWYGGSEVADDQDQDMYMKLLAAAYLRELFDNQPQAAPPVDAPEIAGSEA